MSWTITGTQKVAPTVWDPYFLNVSLLLHGNGTNGSTTITDSSLSPKTVTAFGNAQISTAQSKFGNSSIAFDGNGDYITAPSDQAFEFRTENFTIEMWARFNAISNQLLFDTLAIGGAGARGSGFAWVLLSNGKLDFYSNGAFRGASVNVLSIGTWYHLALVRSGNNFNYYINGTKDQTTYSQSLDIKQDNAFTCGRVGDAPDYYLNGYIDDLRITKGVARYTSNFTPPTAPFPDI